jgi:hypothetical protein
MEIKMQNKNSEYLELLKQHLPISEFNFDLEIIKNPPAKYIEDFFNNLKAHKNYEVLKDNFIYDKELNVFIQIHNRFPNSEIADLTQEQIFFYPFMSKEEIKRIFNIKSSEDYLLWLRAEQVETEIRLKRTFSKLKKKFGSNWNFTNYFESNQYKKYLSKLNPELRNKCLDIPHGTIHSNEANGVCIKTPFGSIIVLSYSLRHFLFYMNLFQFGEQLDVKQEDINSAFILAIRIMFGKESLDFELDTRGKLPKAIKREIDALTDWQMQFIIGHEYAHHYLGHLDNQSVLKSHNRFSVIDEKIKHYTYKQKCEFEADINSINEANYNDNDKSQLLNGAFLFFMSLHIYDKIEDYIFPRNNYPRTHPEPIDRLWNLRNSINSNLGYSTEVLNNFEKGTNSYVDYFLKEYLPYNIEKIEMVGSVYLPNYKKKFLIDRLDI